MVALKCTEIPVDQIEYNEPKQNQHGGNMVGLSFNNSKITIQIPKAPVPFGVNSLTTDKNEIRKSLDISFRGLENNEQLQALFDWVRDFDSRNKTMAIANCEPWLKRKTLSEEVVGELYKPLVNDKSQGKYPPTMRFKLPTNADGDFTGKVFAPDRTPLTEADITKGSEVSLLVDVQPMWFVNKQFGVTFKVSQIKLFKKESFNDYAFRDDEDDTVQPEPNGGAEDTTTS